MSPAFEDLLQLLGSCSFANARICPAAVFSASRRAGSIASHASASPAAQFSSSIPRRTHQTALHSEAMRDLRCAAPAQRCVSQSEAPNPAPCRLAVQARPEPLQHPSLLALEFESLSSFSSILFLQHNLVQRILDDSGCPRSLQLRNHVPRHALLHNRIHRHPLRIAELRNRR